MIRERLDLEAELVPGKRGQYDVVADGEVVASRGGSFLTRLIGGGWPDPDEVLVKLERLAVAAGD